MSDRNNLLELPKGWCWITGNDLFSFITSGSRGWAQYYSDEGSIFLRIGNLDHDSISLDLADVQRVQAPKDVEGTRTRVETGDILISITADVGMIAVVPPRLEEGFINQHVALARPALGADSSYIGWYLASREGGQKQFKALQRGATKVGLGLDDVRAVNLPFPPLPEQHRIVAKIEELFTKLDAGVASLKAAKAQLKRYRQAVLKAAVEGELTREWREQHQHELEPASELLARILRERRAKWEADQLAKMQAQGKPPKDDKWKTKYQEPAAPNTAELPQISQVWEWVSVEALSTKVVDGVHKKPNYVPTGIPFVTVRNLTAGKSISFDKLNYITPEDHAEFIKRANPEKGDILVSKDGTLGVIRVIRTDRVFSIFVSVALIKPVIYETSEFLGIALSSPQVQRQMVPKGSGLQHIHLEDLRADCVPLSPLAEQRQIVAEVERRLSVADEIEATLNAELKRAERLRQAILKRAFEGKLVPQDPLDEPAAVLLERIKAEKIQQPIPGRGSKKKREKFGVPPSGGQTCEKDQTA